MNLPHKLILLIREKYAFFTLVKTHTLVSHTFPTDNIRNTCVAAIGAMRFSCVASAAHFFIIHFYLKE